MSVTVGSARSSYGNTKAGDQHSGQEVSTQAYYVHSKGWRVLVCTVPGAGPLIAGAMKRACDNNSIGYDQATRNTLIKNVKPYGYDPARTTKAVNTDCSALVRVCVQYALAALGIDYTVPDFITSSEASVLLKSGYFRELTGDKYTKKSDYLPQGAILVTRTKGHTVVVLNSGSKCADTYEEAPAKLVLGDRMIENGMSGDDVREAQSLLLQLGYDLGSWGCDGDYGDASEQAVRLFQADAGIEIDGIIGEETIAALYRCLGGDGTTGGHVRIEGGNCYVRDVASTSGDILGVAYRGSVYTLLETAENGWHMIRFADSFTGWVSGKYSTIIE